jgi:hypothetical protein
MRAEGHNRALRILIVSAKSAQNSIDRSQSRDQKSFACRSLNHVHLPLPRIYHADSNASSGPVVASIEVSILISMEEALFDYPSTAFFVPIPTSTPNVALHTHPSTHPPPTLSATLRNVSGISANSRMCPTYKTTSLSLAHSEPTLSNSIYHPQLRPVGMVVSTALRNQRALRQRQGVCLVIFYSGK